MFMHGAKLQISIYLGSSLGVEAWGLEDVQPVRGYECSKVHEIDVHHTGCRIWA